MPRAGERYFSRSAWHLLFLTVVGGREKAMCKDTDSDQTSRQRAFDALYEGTPPWDIGRPQAEIVRLTHHLWSNGDA